MANKITHYGLYRKSNPDSPMVKDADFFTLQGGLVEPWGQNWEPIYNAESVGEARRKFAQSKNVTLSSIYSNEV